MENRLGEAIWDISTQDGFPKIYFECFRCDEMTEGFSVCLKCDKPTYEVYGEDKMSDNILTKEELIKTADEAAKTMASEFSTLIVELVTATWNEAIEAAAEELKNNATGNWPNMYMEAIRKLKID